MSDQDGEMGTGKDRTSIVGTTVDLNRNAGAAANPGEPSDVTDDQGAYQIGGLASHSTCQVRAAPVAGQRLLSPTADG